jgi:hypothetical protein
MKILQNLAWLKTKVLIDESKFFERNEGFFTA